MLVSSGASVRASKTKIFTYSVKLFLAVFLDEVLIRLEVCSLKYFSIFLKYSSSFFLGIRYFLLFSMRFLRVLTVYFDYM